jgi:hypothetical protein
VRCDGVSGRSGGGLLVQLMGGEIGWIGLNEGVLVSTQKWDKRKGTHLVMAH